MNRLDRFSKGGHIFANKVVTYSVKWVCICISVWFCSKTLCFPQTHVVTGQLEAKYYTPGGEEFGSQITKFTIKFGGGQWLLKSEYGENWFWLVGGDGTNTYSVLHDPKALKLAAPATVFSGDFPQDARDRVSIPWLAFCSSHFVSNSPSRYSIPALWSHARTDPLAHVCSTKINLFVEPPYLPKQIEWVTSSDQIGAANTNKLLRVEGASHDELEKRSIDYSTRILAGKTLGSYQVTETTNVAGVTLPLAFELRAFSYLTPEGRELAQQALDSRSKTNGWKPRTIADTYLIAYYAGSVSKVSVENTPPIALPESGLLMSIADFRLSSRDKSIDYVSYVSKQWKPEVDAELFDLLESKKKNAPAKSIFENFATRRPKVVRVLIFSIFLVPAVVWVVRKFKQKQINKGYQ